MIRDLLCQLAGARVFDLAQPYFVGMPHHPSHPPFLYSLVKRHGDYVGPQGNSSASDAIALGSHVGTHIDALSHFSCCGKLHGGVAAEAEQSWEGGLEKHSIDGVPPILRRGVLLDVAGRHGEESRFARARWCCCAPDGRNISATPASSSRRSVDPDRRSRVRNG
jgi:hypothetical protein